MGNLRWVVVAAALLLGGTAAAEGRDFLVNAEWLEEHLEDPGLVLLEVRYHPHRYFTVGLRAWDTRTFDCTTAGGPTGAIG